jgi:hypothetical protein
MEPKKRFGSKAKGKSFERYTADFLRTVFNLPFQRVPNSGAFLGRSNFYRSDTLSEAQNLLLDGDIIVPEQLNFFKFECKFHADLSLDKLFSSNKKFESWINQVKDNIEDKKWFLVFKQNNILPYVAFDINLLSVTTKTNKKVLLENYLDYQHKYIITKFESFFNTNKDFILDLNSDLVKQKKELTLLLEKQKNPINCVKLNNNPISNFKQENDLIPGIIRE